MSRTLFAGLDELKDQLGWCCPALDDLTSNEAPGVAKVLALGNSIVLDDATAARTALRELVDDALRLRDSGPNLLLAAADLLLFAEPGSSVAGFAHPIELLATDSLQRLDSTCLVPWQRGLISDYLMAGWLAVYDPETSESVASLSMIRALKRGEACFPVASEVLRIESVIRLLNRPRLASRPWPDRAKAVVKALAKRFGASALAAEARRSSEGMDDFRPAVCRNLVQALHERRTASAIASD